MGYLLLSYRRLLRNRSFVLFMVASLFSGMGSIIGNIGRDVLVLDLTNTGKTLLSLGIVVHIPTILLGPISGFVSDRFNRKLVVVIGRSLLGGLVLLFCFTHSYLVIFILVIIFVCITTFTNPASQSMIPEIVNRDELIHFNSLISIVGTIVAISGASLANVILAKIGIRATFVVDSFTFLVGALIFWKIRYVSAAAATRPQSEVSLRRRFRTMLGTLSEGLIYLKSNRIVFMIIMLSLCVTFCASIINCLLVAMVSGELHGSYANYAELLVWGPIGYLLGSIAVGPLKKILHEKYLICIGLLFVGVFLIIFSLQTKITYARYLFVPMHMGNAFFFIGKDTLVQSLTENAYLGRVLTFSSVMGAVASVVVLSGARAVYDIVGLRNLYFGTSVTVAVLALLATTLFIIKR